MFTQVDLKVEKPIVENNPTNCFQLTVEYMHGDADGDSEKDFIYENTEEGIAELKLDLLSLEAVDDMDYHEEQLTPLLEELGFEGEELEERLDGFHGNFYEGDHTTDYSMPAAHVKRTVVYFDNEGNPFEVNVNFK